MSDIELFVALVSIPVVVLLVCAYKILTMPSEYLRMKADLEYRLIVERLDKEIAETEAARKEAEAAKAKAKEAKVQEIVLAAEAAKPKTRTPRKPRVSAEVAELRRVAKQKRTVEKKAVKAYSRIDDLGEIGADELADIRQSLGL